MRLAGSVGEAPLRRNHEVDGPTDPAFELRLWDFARDDADPVGDHQGFAVRPQGGDQLQESLGVAQAR